MYHPLSGCQLVHQSFNIKYISSCITHPCNFSREVYGFLMVGAADRLETIVKLMFFCVKRLVFHVFLQNRLLEFYERGNPVT